MKEESIRKFAERLDASLAFAGIGKSILAEKLGITRSTVSRWYSLSLPAPRTMKQAAEVLGVRREWLASGSGEMLATSGAGRQPENTRGQHDTLSVDVMALARVAANPGCSAKLRIQSAETLISTLRELQATLRDEQHNI